MRLTVGTRAPAFEAKALGRPSNRPRHVPGPHRAPYADSLGVAEIVTIRRQLDGGRPALTVPAGAVRQSGMAR